MYIIHIKLTFSFRNKSKMAAINHTFTPICSLITLGSLSRVTGLPEQFFVELVDNCTIEPLSVGDSSSRLSRSSSSVDGARVEYMFEKLTKRLDGIEDQSSRVMPSSDVGDAPPSLGSRDAGAPLRQFQNSMGGSSGGASGQDFMIWQNEVVGRAFPESGIYEPRSTSCATKGIGPRLQGMDHSSGMGRARGRPVRDGPMGTRSGVMLGTTPGI